MDLLLDVDMLLDLCTPRPQGFEAAANAVALCMEAGGTIWLYAGSAQTYEYTLRLALKTDALSRGQDLSNAACAELARRTLRAFAEDKSWLAALVREADSFAAPDAEAQQLLLALERFPTGTIKLLTRDTQLLLDHPDKTVSPEQFGELPLPAKNIDFIDLKRQQDQIRPQLETNLHRVLHHGRYIMGSEVTELEARLADYVGVKHCIGVASGTDALLIAMMALGIGPGDEVITTPFTFVATGEMIALLGAKPVFVDIDPHTYNIDPTLIEPALTPRTKAILPVSLYGQCADMDPINAIAERHALPVIEDAAQSFGATYKGRRSCGLSAVGATSFFPSKPLGGYGDGGACFTDDDDLAKAMREIRLHGQDRRYHHPRVGVNGRLDTLQAAILLAKLDTFPREVQARADIGARYSELLEHAVDIPTIRPENTSVYAQYTIGVDHRDRVQQRLRDQGVPTAVHYPVPLNRQPAYAHLCCPDCTPNADTAAARVISLPMHPWLTEAEQERIVNAVLQAVG